MDVLAFEFEMGLFPAVLDEAKQQGHRPRAQDHPAGGLRQARGGQGPGAVLTTWPTSRRTPRFAKEGHKTLTLAIELTDFSVYYSQGAADAVAAELKEGKSEVVCDDGQLYDLAPEKRTP